MILYKSCAYRSEVSQSAVPGLSLFEGKSSALSIAIWRTHSRLALEPPSLLSRESTKQLLATAYICNQHEYATVSIIESANSSIQNATSKLDVRVVVATAQRQTRSESSYILKKTVCIVSGRSHRKVMSL